MLSLQSDGKFYGCCESQKSIGFLSDPIKKVVNNYLNNSGFWWFSTSGSSYIGMNSTSFVLDTTI
jgi:hypothetical protein